MAVDARVIASPLLCAHADDMVGLKLETKDRSGDPVFVPQDAAPPNRRRTGDALVRRLIVGTHRRDHDGQGA